jgi:predicted DNA-binding transcriptional regulator AlpA
MGARTLPDWPRMLRRSLAAAYLDMSVAEFERAMASGALPHPVKIGEQERWSRTTLDETVDRITGVQVPDFRKKARFYAQG